MSLLWNRTTSRKHTPKYQREANPTPEREKIEHSQGWPHYDLKGNCICLCKRCMGSGGCICRGCAGRGHAGCDKADTPIEGQEHRRRDDALTGGTKREKIQV